jgi:hypothetical protein
MNTLSCPARFDWGISENDHTDQEPAVYSFPLQYSVKGALSRGLPSATRQRMGRRPNLEMREIATCDISDLVRQLYQKWGENTVKLKWSTYKELAQIIISDECYSSVDFIASNVVFSPLDKTNVVSIGHVDEAWFSERADRWEKETAIHSSPGATYLHKDYMAVITRGVEDPKRVVPMILKRLSGHGGDWFFALEQITDANPARECENYECALKAWLEWAQRNEMTEGVDVVSRA